MSGSLSDPASGESHVTDHRGFIGLVAVGLSSILVTGALPPAASASPADAPGVTPRAIDHRAAQWWYDAAGLQGIHAAGYTGAGVRVGVIDSPIDSGHGDLDGQVVEEWIMEGGRITAADAGQVESASGHATHVASIIAGNDDGYGITGVAPDADIVAMQSRAAEGAGDTPLTGPQVAEAVRFIAERDVDVINMSLGFDDIFEKDLESLRTMCAAIEEVTSNGVIVVVSAGNSGADGNPEFFPASCSAAISVGAVNSALIATDWSSFDRSVTIAAPGANIAAAMDRSLGSAAMIVNFHNESHPAIEASGTSMAAPFVAGVVALMLQRQPGMTPAQVRQVLIDTAIDRGRGGFDPRYGYGVIDPAQALGVTGTLQPSPRLTLKVTTNWAQTYLSWNSQDPEVDITDLTLTFSGLDDVVVVSRDLDPDALRVLMPTPTVDGYWQLRAKTADGDVVTSTRVYAAPEPMIASPPVEVADDGTRWMRDGTLKLALQCTARLRDTMTIHYSMRWNRPKNFRALLPPGITPKPVTGTFTSCREMESVVSDPAQYRYVEDGQERIGTLTGPAAAAVRQYARAGYVEGSAGAFRSWTKEGGKAVGGFSEFLPFATMSIRSWYVAQGSRGRLYVQVDPSKVTSETPQLTLRTPDGPTVKLDINAAGYGTALIPLQPGPYAVVDIRGTGITGISPDAPRRIYAFRTDDCLPCRLSLN